MKKRELTPEQTAARDARREQFKSIWRQVAQMTPEKRAVMAAKLGYVTVEGRPLSICNQLLVALQLDGASVLGGFRQWLAQGRAVRKGQHGASIWIPTGCRKTEPAPGTDAGSEEERQGFIMGTVFDISQTDPIATAENMAALGQVLTGTATESEAAA